MDNRQQIFQRMCARVSELPEKAIESLRSGKRHHAVMIIVPHHDFRKDLAKLVHEAFLEAGFSVDTANMSHVSGDEFSVYISSISTTAGRGRSLDAMYWPPTEGLTGAQTSALKELKTAIWPCLKSGDHPAEIIEY